jgi:hypothetical protein
VVSIVTIVRRGLTTGGASMTAIVVADAVPTFEERPGANANTMTPIATTATVIEPSASAARPG